MKVTKPMAWEQLSSYLEDRSQNNSFYLADNNLQKYSQDKVITYDQAKASDHVYVVIGGESQGISPEAIQ
jgi:NOL1/NOP2/fmu family ribosome biogenesis protein